MPIDVRSWGKNGRHLLVLSVSQFDPERTSGLSSATDRAGDALGQCEIPLGPNWLFWFNRQRGVQLGHSSYTFTAVAASNPLQS